MSSKKEENDAPVNEKNLLPEVESKPKDSEAVEQVTENDISENKDTDEKESVKEGNNKETDGNEENESDKEEDDKSDGEKKESEDEQEMGLLDRPVEVTGCRARKQVERLEVSFALPTKDKQIPEGRGQKLGDCPRIEFQIAKHSVADLKPLHRVLFNRQGTASDTKKNIRKFSGFPFEQDSSDFEQKKSKMEKFSIPLLKGMCEVLDLERSGTKEDIIIRLLKFLVCPSDSGKALPKKKSSGHDKKNAAKKRVKNDKKKSKGKNSEEEGDDEIAPSDDEVSDASANEEETSDVETKKKSKAKSKKTPIKVKTLKKEKPKKETKVSKRKRDAASDSSEDSEPAAKKSKLPDDDDIQKLVKSILEQADLHEITMKKVIKQVYDTYPDCDLTDKKSFIKTTIKSVLKLNEKGEDRRFSNLFM